MLSDIEKLEAAVNNFNSSPWINLGTPVSIQDSTAQARVLGVDKVIDNLRREDIRLYRKEEALCGNI